MRLFVLRTALFALGLCFYRSWLGGGGVGGLVMKLYIALMLTSYNGSTRGGTGRELAATHATFRRKSCGRTGLRVSDVGVLCPGTFSTQERNVDLVRRVRLGRRRRDLICLSDVLRAGRGRFRSVGGGCMLRGSTRCRRANGCF